ncbi:hypothetical protein GCM10010978_19400 [Compostibacillus humi]|uniref:Methyltransferase domain-containing protein n=1 Tax=Compostibacillus humi TaxID=1245525 RepID=A0A8J2XIF2_9BACI|nr:class I SAM-dependent methyltransferase [Compostibacillus humi]GFZ77907.1 hypothetical protein GCM10010978_19400 [Compostibacillus humi]
MKNKKRTLKEIHDYWINNSKPQRYALHIKRSEFLQKYVDKYITPKGEILEIGCNVGRNLHYLYEHNYKNLTGIEISEEAIKELKKTYPSLARNVKIIHSSVEDSIKKLPENHYDLVFTMAVFEHIHTDSDWIFAQVAKITKHYLITIEAEDIQHWRFFPRNYKEVFEKYGFLQVEEDICPDDLGLNGYKIRVLKKQ